MPIPFLHQAQSRRRRRGTVHPQPPGPPSLPPSREPSVAALRIPFSAAAARTPSSAQPSFLRSSKRLNTPSCPRSPKKNPRKWSSFVILEVSPNRNHSRARPILNEVIIPITQKKLRMLRGIILQTLSSPSLIEIYSFGPFNYNIQKRWKKPVDSAQTRLESRTIDFTIDKLMSQLKKLRQALGVHELMSKRRGHYTSVQLLSKWRHMSGLNTSIGAFLRKYPHIFEVYVHPVKRNLCCKTTQKMVDLITQESVIIKETEQDAVRRLKKLLMLSANGTLHLHALWLIREELGLPDDFRNSVIPNYPDDFRVEEPDTLVLVSWDSSLAEASIERWRENEYREKWLSEHETKFAFPIQFPTGYKIEKGMREKLKNWQMLPYLKPYEKKDDLRVGSVKRFEKRVVSILHEFLTLLVEKRLAVERLAHFRRDLSMEVNVRELILKHPGIFYISTKGNTQTLFLREAYCKGSLVEPNPIYVVRRKMLDLVLMGNRNTGQMQQMEQLEERHNLSSNDSLINDCNDEWLLPTTEDTVEGQIIDNLDSIGEHYAEVEQE